MVWVRVQLSVNIKNGKIAMKRNTIHYRNSLIVQLTSKFTAHNWYPVPLRKSVAHWLNASNCRCPGSNAAARRKQAEQASCCGSAVACVVLHSKFIIWVNFKLENLFWIIIKFNSLSLCLSVFLSLESNPFTSIVDTHLYCLQPRKTADEDEINAKKIENKNKYFCNFILILFDYLVAIVRSCQQLNSI